jgi:hypothetical protein
MNFYEMACLAAGNFWKVLRICIKNYPKTPNISHLIILVTILHPFYSNLITILPYCLFKKMIFYKIACLIIIQQLEKQQLFIYYPAGKQ